MSTIPEPGTDAFRDAIADATTAEGPLAAAIADALDAKSRLVALRTIRRESGASWPLHLALGAVWSDFAMLPELLAEAEHEANRTEAIVEAERRSTVAGATSRAVSCECGHSGSGRHTVALTDDGRLPCVTDGCPCMDLVYRV